MTEQIVPPVPHAENHGNAGETGEVVETVGIEPTICYSRGESPKTPHLQVECETQISAPRRANVRGHGTEGVSPMQHEPIRIPLRDRSRAVVAYALIDAEDAHLTALTWYLDVGRKRTGPGYVRNGATDRILHREVMGLHRGDPRRVDHINGDTLDNRRANLRFATDAENAQNQGSRGGSSRFRGVTWDKSRCKWMATAMLNGRRRTIGRFDSEEEAGAAAAEFRREHMPFSAEAA